MRICFSHRWQPTKWQFGYWGRFANRNSWTFSETGWDRARGATIGGCASEHSRRKFVWKASHLAKCFMSNCEAGCCRCVYARVFEVLALERQAWTKIHHVDHTKLPFRLGSLPSLPSQTFSKVFLLALLSVGFTSSPLDRLLLCILLLPLCIFPRRASNSPFGLIWWQTIDPYCKIKNFRTVLNPLWGHRSITIDSDLGALQPYFLVVMVTPASPFFACMQLKDKRSCWRFEKNLRSVEKVVVLALWSCASLHPRALQWSCTQFLSWCLVCWAGSEQFSSARFQLRSRRQRGLDNYLSIRENSAFLGKLGSLSATWRTWEATPGSNTLCGFAALYAFFLMSSLWDDFWQTFQSATNFWTCFSWSVRQKLSDKVRL